jgi:hypothetical protein
LQDRRDARSRLLQNVALPRSLTESMESARPASVDQFRMASPSRRRSSTTTGITRLVRVW